MVGVARPPRRRRDADPTPAAASVSPTALWCPFDLGVDSLAAMVNCELVDHPVYAGLELQWFDDPSHGTGLLAFLQRRDDRRVDYYVQPGLVVDRDGYELGSGTGEWIETVFERDRLDVDGEGVVVDVRFTDSEGRGIEAQIDDRAAGPRDTAELLAPIGDSIDSPASLLLVYLHGFDLVRRGPAEPVVRIDGGSVSVGCLPGGWLHRRHPIKAAAPLTVAMFCRSGTRDLEPIDPTAPGSVLLGSGRRSITGLTVEANGAHAELRLWPPVPPLGRIADGQTVSGKWAVEVDRAPITGGRWTLRRHGTRIEAGLEVTRRWRPPAGQPPLMRVVTRLLPVFRRWPTTYRWRADIRLDGTPTITSRWERSSSRRRSFVPSLRRRRGGT